MNQKLTLAEKVWRDHVVQRGDAGAPDLIFIDFQLLHEVTSPQAFDGLRLAGRKLRHPELHLATEDHNVPTDIVGGAAPARPGWPARTRPPPDAAAPCSPPTRPARRSRASPPRSRRCATRPTGQMPRRPSTCDDQPSGTEMTWPPPGSTEPVVTYA